ncbi:hypothetical protein [Sulfitobacter sp. 1A12056]|uniref:hypothetical protein n=1 Tax=Sulfitobacter sp. 1A12056 TaxID=3368592 RepID=UPI003746DB39
MTAMAPWPACAAIGIWTFAIGGALTVFAPAHNVEGASQLPAQQTEGWVVQEGSLSITITKMGAKVTGGFANWQAEIEYDEVTRTGTVKTVINTSSLTLGSVTDQAKGPEFFDVAG